MVVFHSYVKLPEGNHQPVFVCLDPLVSSNIAMEKPLLKDYIFPAINLPLVGGFSS